MTHQIKLTITRAILYLLIGMAVTAGTGFLIAQLQALLEWLGYPLPRPIFLGVLAGSVVYVAKWAMEIYQRQLDLLRTQREKLRAFNTKG